LLADLADETAHEARSSIHSNRDRLKQVCEIAPAAYIFEMISSLEYMQFICVRMTDDGREALER